jgi:hypothetical protein
MMQTQRTKAKIEENLAILCATLGLDQTSTDPDNQRKILVVYNTLRWTADYVEAQTMIIAKWQPQDDQCTEYAWGDWTITKEDDGWHLLVSSGVRYGPFPDFESVTRHAEEV